MSDNKAYSCRHPGRGASGCHLTLECTGISSTSGDTGPAGEIPEAPWELEPELVRVEPGQGVLARAREQGYPTKS